jgi:hypothetical protein
MILSAYLEPTPFSRFNSSAVAVLMFIFSTSPALTWMTLIGPIKNTTRTIKKNLRLNISPPFSIAVNASL